MNGTGRPLPVTILAWLLIAVGAVGFGAHFTGLWAGGAFSWDGAAVELVEIVALVSGAFMLRGRNWARWLALAWMALHVAISFGAILQLAIHAVFLAVIAWIVLRPGSARYFRS